MFREVLVLREIEELSYGEIASVIGSPAGTVMSRLSRSRAELKIWLEALTKQENGDSRTSHIA
jgi:DNA-directed RNA polymerase specialized sigma24 family protein